MNLSYEPADWRLIIDEQPRSGAANMALDQAIAEACAAGDVPPTLRFYRWQPPAVSLGRHQTLEEIDLDATVARGYDIVRRPTGGRAILHTDELTYAVAAPATEPRVEGSIMDAYLRLSNALLTGLRRLGLEADKAAGSVRAGPDVSAACFEVPSAYEITARGPQTAGQRAKPARRLRAATRQPAANGRSRSLGRRAGPGGGRTRRSARRVDRARHHAGAGAGRG